MFPVGQVLRNICYFFFFFFGVNIVLLLVGNCSYQFVKLVLIASILMLIS